MVVYDAGGTWGEGRKCDFQTDAIQGASGNFYVYEPRISVDVYQSGSFRFVTFSVPDQYDCIAQLPDPTHAFNNRRSLAIPAAGRSIRNM